jgi:membrane protein
MLVEKLLCLMKDFGFRFINDDVMRVAAQTTYYFIFALFPFMLFLVTMIGFMPQFGQVANLDFIAELIPQHAFTIINGLWIEIVENKNGTVLSAGFIFAIWISSAGVQSLISGFNRAYDQEENRSYIFVTLTAVSFTIQLSLLIVLSLVLIVFGEIIGHYLVTFLNISSPSILIWNNFRLLIALLALLITFIFLYHSTPACRLKLREVVPGACAATLGWLGISVGFSIYANNFADYSIIYGSLGGAIVLMLWLYLSSIIILCGAELNAALAFQREGREKSRLPRF